MVTPAIFRASDDQCIFPGIVQVMTSWTHFHHLLVDTAGWREGILCALPIIGISTCWWESTVLSARHQPTPCPLICCKSCKTRDTAESADFSLTITFSLEINCLEVQFLIEALWSKANTKFICWLDCKPNQMPCQGALCFYFNCAWTLLLIRKAHIELKVLKRGFDLCGP